MRRVLALLSLTIVLSCAAPAPPPVTVPEEPVAPVPASPVEERVIRSVRVAATSLNVRASASTDAEVVTQVRKGTALDVLREDESWVEVRLADGSTGWVAARFVSGGGETKQAGARKKKSGGCPADSDYAFTETPMPSFSDRGAHGIVVVEANVNASGTVTKTRVVSNGTGDETLAFLAEKEIKAAKFSPPIRNCVPRAFIFTYKRAF